LQCWLAFC
jgi:hypothetical protein